jgi:hypothetical protein
MKALPSIYREGFITEGVHVNQSPYYGDKVRRCKKPATCELFGNISRERFQFYLVVLTADLEMPFKGMASSDRFFPLFFNQKTNSPEEFPNLGGINWFSCQSLFEGLDSHFSESYEKLKLAELKEDPLAKPSAEDSPYSKRQLIEYGGKLCLLTCKGYSYAIRGVENGKFSELDRCRQDKEKFLSLAPHIKVIGKAPPKSIKEEIFWVEFLSKDGKNLGNSSL